MHVRLPMGCIRIVSIGLLVSLLPSDQFDAAAAVVPVRASLARMMLAARI